MDDRSDLPAWADPERRPAFTTAQVAWLKALHPPRCLRMNETVEDHLRYAGKVDLVALIEANCPLVDDLTKVEETHEQRLDRLEQEALASEGLEFGIPIAKET